VGRAPSPRRGVAGVALRGWGKKARLFLSGAMPSSARGGRGEEEAIGGSLPSRRLSLLPEGMLGLFSLGGLSPPLSSSGGEGGGRGYYTWR